MLESNAIKHQCWRNTENKCVGSKCMAWKWGRFHDHRERHLWSKKLDKQVTSAYGDDADWRLVDPDTQAPEQHGTCAALNSQQ
jgi:hypothetical protein